MATTLLSFESCSVMARNADVFFLKYGENLEEIFDHSGLPLSDEGTGELMPPAIYADHANDGGGRP